MASGVKTLRGCLVVSMVLLTYLDVSQRQVGLDGR